MRLKGSSLMGLILSMESLRLQGEKPLERREDGLQMDDYPSPVTHVEVRESRNHNHYQGGQWEAAKEYGCPECRRSTGHNSRCSRKVNHG